MQYKKFQSTLPRRKRQSPRFVFAHSVSISIHASAKEATDLSSWVDSTFGISIHASAKEATMVSPMSASFKWDFNPRFREGSDLYLLHLDRPVRISIHASAKEATQGTLPLFQFLHTFQSTLPRRKRHFIGFDELTHFTISIHASAKEATQLSADAAGKLQFQSTLPRRKRHHTPYTGSHLLRFQSTLPRRKRRLSLTGRKRLNLFQSTLPRRKRPTGSSNKSISCNFNPRFREGSDSRYVQFSCVYLQKS